MLRMAIFFLLATIMVGNVKTENCNYQFTVPESSGVKCSGEESFQMKSSIDHINGELIIAERRQQAMSESFSREISKLDIGAETMRNVSTMLRMDLQKIQSMVTGMAPLAEEVKSLRDMITNSKESLEPKFSALQERMMAIVEKFQNESAKVSDHAQAMIVAQTSQLAHQAQNLILLKKESEDFKVQNAGQQEILDDLRNRLHELETNPPISSQLQGLKSSVNLLQSTLTMAYRRNRDEIQTLKAQLIASRKPTV
ncbi:uncharacterized protein LOC132560153 [Ylistrum balloti]|uniref:uncharacterized protein LOC132560153 n=1 Tax=Ylistrum balloti TaxID=509963 RepID=UPI0029059D5A|nr:uncharacterized protein LOC132560153 [Ylistrum balloti]